MLIAGIAEAFAQACLFSNNKATDFYSLGRLRIATKDRTDKHGTPYTTTPQNSFCARRVKHDHMRLNNYTAFEARYKHLGY